MIELVVQQGVPQILLRVEPLDADEVAIDLTSIASSIRRGPVDRSLPDTTWPEVITTIDWAADGDDPGWWVGSMTAEHASLVGLGCAPEGGPRRFWYDVFITPVDGVPYVPIWGYISAEGLLSP